MKKILGLTIAMALSGGPINATEPPLPEAEPILKGEATLPKDFLDAYTVREMVQWCVKNKKELVMKDAPTPPNFFSLAAKSLLGVAGILTLCVLENTDIRGPYEYNKTLAKGAKVVLFGSFGYMLAKSFLELCWHYPQAMAIGIMTNLIHAKK